MQCGNFDLRLHCGHYKSYGQIFTNLMAEQHTDFRIHACITALTENPVPLQEVAGLVISLFVYVMHISQH